MKNIDDFLLFSDTLEGLEEQIKKLVQLCRKINLKLAPSKFTLSDSVKFGGQLLAQRKLPTSRLSF